MKGIIYYYSGSGNTKLACEYIAEKIRPVKFELADITKAPVANLSDYDVSGFATFADFCGIPKLFDDFIKQLPEQKSKVAFIFNTFGMMSGGTLRILNKKLVQKGFNIINGFSLHTPENYPPLIAGGKGSEESPNKTEIAEFYKFINSLDEQFNCIHAGRELNSFKINYGGLFRFFPKPPKIIRIFMMGKKAVDSEKCNQCGICELKCPYNAVKCLPNPVFDEKKCEVCWACYNHCPQKAIFTDKLKNKGHYSEPNKQVIQRLKP